MNMFFVYILKSALCLVAYYLLYKLFLSRDTFYRFNRFALASLMICSFILPLMQFSLADTTDADIAGFSLAGLPQLASVEDIAETPLWLKLVTVMLLLYLAGIVIFAMRTLISYISLWRVIRSCNEQTLPEAFASQPIHLMVSKRNVAPFSWMNYIVVSQHDLDENGRSILLHELGHIRHHHTIDLIFTELCIIVQWFNPAIWLMREELQAIHEFEADEAVLNAGVNAQEYQLLLIKKAAGSRLQSITNSLHQSSIKKRITMMQKKKSSQWAQAKFALAVPVAALSMVLFATQTATALSSEIAGCKVSNLFSGNQENPELIAENTTPQAEVKKQEAPDEPFTVVEKMPEYPGGGAAMMKFIADNLKYPKECADEKIDGRVVLSFIVEKDGSVSTVEEMKSPDARLTVEAIRVISSMPKWTPGQQRGENVRVKFVIPVTFALNSDKAPTVIEVKESSNANIGITGDNKPCIVIDGKVVPYEELRNTPSDKVESINVYKDEATKQKYLSKSPDAKNGVIVVTLKK